jgi:hypothetical protein
MVVSMAGANQKVLLTRVVKCWREIVDDHIKRQNEKVQEADQEELVEVVKELEKAYHQERYQTKAQKERIKELEAEVERVTGLLDTERKNSDSMQRQVMESESTATALPVLYRMEDALKKVLSHVSDTSETVSKMNETTSRTAMDVFGISQVTENLANGDAGGQARFASRQQAWNKRDVRDQAKEMEELEMAMKKWYKFEEQKREAVSRIHELGGSPPRCVTLHANLPPSGAPSSPVKGPPVILPPPFQVTGDEWPISAETAWAHAAKEVAREAGAGDRDSNATDDLGHQPHHAGHKAVHSSPIPTTAPTPPLPPYVPYRRGSRAISPLTSPPPIVGAAEPGCLHEVVPPNCLPDMKSAMMDAMGLSRPPPRQADPVVQHENFRPPPV